MFRTLRGPGAVWLVGAAAGAVLGAARTREAALHLLAKNRALLDAGVPALPGPGHLDTLGSWAPAGAGAVFFGLSLGLGGAALLALLAAALGLAPGRTGRLLPWATALVPLGLGFWGRDWGLAAAAEPAALAAAAWAAGRADRRVPVLRLACAALALVGLLPWARAPEGPFTRFRDRVLLARETGPALALDTFYYRWTLYPAEALKPLAARSQPTVWADPAAGDRAALCEAAARVGLWCVDDPSAADVRIEPGPRLVRGPAEAPWTGPPEARRQAWNDLSARADRARPLRRATAVSLFYGCPLVLAGILSGLAVWLGAWMPHPGHRKAAALVCAAFLGGLVAAVSMQPPWLVRVRRELADAPLPGADRVEAALRARRPVERFYGARAAGRLGEGWEPALEAALADPVINVRYAAAQALGRIASPRAREVLRAVLEGPADWYVKERAWAGLRRSGWRPGR